MQTLESWARWSIYSLGGEGIHGPRPFTVRRQGRPVVQASRAGCLGFQGAPDVRAGEAGCPGWSGSTCCSRVRRGRISGLGAGCPGWRGQMSGAWELFSVFFRRHIHASLADGVVVPWRLHSSSTSVKLQQYLCMHTGEVSSSIPSSKGSSEHV